MLLQTNFEPASLSDHTIGLKKELAGEHVTFMLKKKKTTFNQEIIIGMLVPGKTGNVFRQGSNITARRLAFEE